MIDKQSAQHIVTLFENSEETAIQLAVHECALLSLIASHPRPEDFAAEFRTTWQRFGQQHSAIEHGEKMLAHIAEALTRIEESCPVPLGVRPPRS
ncbi:MAG: hypothetical protein AB1443_09865 [Pseudomonadota bacterium]